MQLQYHQPILHSGWIKKKDIDLMFKILLHTKDLVDIRKHLTIY